MGWALLLLAMTFGGEPEKCVASNFGGAADKHRGGKTPCLRPMRRVRIDDHGIAHRTLKCGTRVLVVNPRTGDYSVTRVIDHGPYGAVHEGRWLVKKKRRDPGRWRGCADLTRPVALELGHNGFEPVIVVPLGTGGTGHENQGSRSRERSSDPPRPH